jgi:serine/threonine-protein kinase
VSLSPGTRVGPYEIASQIGMGGMGEVYRATDTNLGRQVAIKVLPDAMAADADRLARFDREAKTLAALNHPNIAAIYGLERSDGQTALVMELVDGPTLADRIAEGAIPIDEALAIAKQMAEALEAAHEQGIIHRDLKPANIKVRLDGTVKVLDFGLAKAMEPAGALSPGLSQSPTITTPAMTQTGLILGTAAYMSPEQAKGKPADKRSDIWSFGCVLYEMLAGKRAFDGEDVSDTLAAVLRGEPDWTALPADTPAGVVALIKRCLERDRSHRVGDVAAALYVLRDPTFRTTRSPQPHVSTSQPTIRSLLIPVLSAVVLAVALTSAVWWRSRPATSLPIVTRFVVPLGDGEVFTDPQLRSIAISPDGKRIAYVVNQQLHLRSMSDPGAKVLVASTNEALGNPAFSPDSQSIVFWSGVSGTNRAPGALKRVSVEGGVPVTLCSTQGFVLGISWDASGILFSQFGKGVLRISPDGGTPETLVEMKDREEGAEIATWPSGVPGNDAVLFTLATVVRRPGIDANLTTTTWDTARVVVQSLRSGQRKTLIEGGSDARYVPTGHLVYAIGGNLFARPFDPKNLTVTGGPVPVLQGVWRTAIARTSTGGAQFSVSETGSAVYIIGSASSSAASDRSRLTLVDRAGQQAPLKLPTGDYERPRVSPRGDQLAVGINDSQSTQVWVYDLAGTRPIRQLTFEGNNRYPVWEPDGQHIAFTSDREHDLGIFRQRSDGTTKAERLTKAEAGTSQTPESWLRDGTRLLFTSSKVGLVGQPTYTLWVLDVRSHEASQFGDVSAYRLISPDFSPDGRWVAYTVTTRATNQVFVQPFPATGARYLIGSGARPQWSPDGRELFFYNSNVGSSLAGKSGGEKTFVVNVTTNPSFAIGNPVELPFNVYGARGPGFGRDSDVFPDGRRFLTVLPSEPTSPAGRPQQMNVVLNWFEELKQRVPPK